MKRIVLGFIFAALACCTASAQSTVKMQAQAVATCGSRALTAGVWYPAFQDLTGTLCAGTGGGGGGGAVTIADGADVAEGALADAAVAAGAAGSTSAKLRRLTTDLSAALTKLDTVIANTSAAIPPQSPKVPIGGVAICDEANGTTNPCTTAATVKAASTPAAATDKAVVVDQRPGTNLAVIGPTADGSAASTPPVLVAGTADGTATGAVAIPKVSVGGLVSTDGSAVTQPVSAGSLPLPSGAATSANQGLPYPPGATPYTATATGTTGATTATLAGASSVTTYLCGFSIRANATAAATGNATVTGVITATLNFTQWTAPNASGLGVTEEIFSPCIPASGANQSIAVVSAAPGTGGVVSVTAWGYKL